MAVLKAGSSSRARSHLLSLLFASGLCEAEKLIRIILFFLYLCKYAHIYLQSRKLPVESPGMSFIKPGLRSKAGSTF